MSLIDYERYEDRYVLGFRLSFKLLSSKKLEVLKRSKIFAVSDDQIFVITDKFSAGIIINELLEENLTILFPGVSVFKLRFDPRAIREPGIIYTISSELRDVPILYVLSVGSDVFLVVRKKDSHRVERAIAKMLETQAHRRCSLAFWRIPYTPRTSS